MNTSDIDPTTRDGDELRVSAHYLQVQPEQPSQFMALFGRENGTPIRIPAQDEDRTDWPLDCLLHATYATAVMENFGLQSHNDAISKLWDSHFYPGGSMNAAQRDLHNLHETVTQKKEQAERQQKERADRADRPRWCNTTPGDADEFSKASTLDLVNYIGYSMLSPEQFSKVMEARQRRAEAAEKEAQAIERNRLEEKVRGWRESTQDEFRNHEVDGEPCSHRALALY